MFRTTLQNVRSRKLRLVSTALAVFLGVAFMTGTLVLTDTIGRTFDTLFADVNAGVDAYVRSDQTVSDRMGDQRGRVDDGLVAAVAQVDGVRAAAPTIKGYAQLLDRHGDAIGSAASGAPTYGGNWIAQPTLNPFHLVAGRAPSGEGEVVIDRGSARTGGFGVGDRTTVLTQAGPVDVEVVGIARFGDADSAAGTSFAMFDLPTAQRLVSAPGRIDGVRVAAAPGVSQEELTHRIASVVPSGVEVVTGAQVTAEDQNAVAKGLRFFDTFLVTFALVALFVGCFIIYNTFSILVAQRRRETALLRAVGASRRQVLASVLGEAVVVGLLGAGAGLVAGVAVAAGLRSMLDALGVDLPAGALVVTAGTVVTSVLTGLVVSVVSAMLPARRAASVPPIEAMRDAALDGADEAGGRRVITGAALGVLGASAIAAGLFGGAGVAPVGIGVALVFLGVAAVGPALVRPVIRVLGAPPARLRGVTGSLARENAIRNPRRTSSTAAALMIGVGLVATMSVLAASAKASVDRTVAQSFTGDIVVDSGAMGFGGLSPALAHDIAALPEVAAATGVRSTAVQIAGHTRRVYGVDGRAVGRILALGHVDGSLDAIEARHERDRAAGSIAVSRGAAVRDRLTVGDVLPARFAQTGAQALRVAAIYENDDIAGDYLLGLGTYEANVDEQLDVKVFVAVADGVRLSDAKAAVSALSASYPQATVQDRAEFAASAATHIDQMLNLVSALLLLAVVIALIGIANTLVLSVVERTRELGLLRAVGMSRRQMRRMVRWESVLVALLGAVLGLSIGIGFGWVLCRALEDQGVNAFVVPGGELVTIAVLAGFAGVVAALLPARRAARLDVLAAIAHG